MNIGRELISYIVRTGEITEFLDAGLNAEWLSSKDDLSRFGVFPQSSEEERAYRYLVKHWEDHRKVPPKELFHQNFPAFRLKESTISTSEIIELANEKRTGQMFVELADILLDAVDGDKPQADGLAAITSTNEQLQRVSRTAKPLFEVMDIDDLMDMTDPEPRIEGFSDVGDVTVIAGFRSGKTFIQLDKSCCIANGIPWKSNRVKQGKVLYVAAEGGRKFKKRIRVWEQENRKIDRANWHVIIRAVQFGNPAHVEELGRVIREGEYDYVVIDTVARCTVGMNESDAKDVGLFINALYELRDVRGEGMTDISAVHHTGWDKGRVRGSTALPAAVDNEYVLEAKDPHELITMKNSKRKDDQEHETLMLRLRRVVLPDGQTSCVVEESDAVDETVLDIMTIGEIVTRSPGTGITEILEEMIKAGST